MKRNSHRRNKNKGQTLPVLLKDLTAKKTKYLSLLIRALVGGLIGFALTSVFSIVTLVVVGTALVTRQPEGFQLLNTALTVAGSGMGAVLGYFLGRGGKTKGK